MIRLGASAFSVRKGSLVLSIFLLFIIAIPQSFSLQVSSVILSSTGTISNTLPLHTDGKYIKNSQNDTVYLRGVWVGAFADTSTGWWGTGAFTWDEAALRTTLTDLKQNWGINCINFFVWGDWWLQNRATTLMGYSTNIGCRDAITRTVQVANEYGIYCDFRLYGCTKAEGRIEGLPFSPTYAWSQQDFVDFWSNVASNLKDYPNVIYTPFDEPTGDYQIYFPAVNQVIQAIRVTGSNQLINVHWEYCGEISWIKNWVLGNYTKENIVFSEHIYRDAGTFAYNQNSPVDLDYVRNYLTGTPSSVIYNCTGTKYYMDLYNVPIWVSAIGSFNGATDDSYYYSFKNTLQVLNEIGVGYNVFTGCRTGTTWAIVVDQGSIIMAPNRVGQALIDAIHAGSV
jgi:hypothetical protein